MKKQIFASIILLMMLSNSLKAQNYKVNPEFKFYLAFEDAVGNKDTIYVGYDSIGTMGLDSIFGEENIKQISFDSIFEVRIVDNYMGMPGEGYINFDPTSFHTKTQILNSPCINPGFTDKQTIMILIRAEHFPISVEWESPEIFNNDSCIYYSIFNHMNTGFWFDVIPFYSPLSPIYFNKFLRLINHTVFDEIPYYNDSINKPPEYYIDNNNDTIRLIYLGLIPKSGILNIIKNDNSIFFNIYPNPAKDYVIIDWKKGLSGKSTSEIFDIYGNMLIKEMLTDKSHRMNLYGFISGIYFIRIISGNTTFIEKILIVN